MPPIWMSQSTLWFTNTDVEVSYGAANKGKSVAQKGKADSDLEMVMQTVNSQNRQALPAAGCKSSWPTKAR